MDRSVFRAEGISSHLAQANTASAALALQVSKPRPGAAPRCHMQKFSPNFQNISYIKFLSRNQPGIQNDK